MSVLKRDEELTVQEIDAEKDAFKSKQIESCKERFITFWKAPKDICFSRENGKRHYGALFSIEDYFEGIKVRVKCEFCGKGVKDELILGSDISSWIREELRK